MHSDGFVTIHSTRLSPLHAGPQEEPLAKRVKMYKTRAARYDVCVVLIINETWEQMKTAYANGIGLREIARNMSLPEGTVLARAKHQGGLDSFSQQRAGKTRGCRFLPLRLKQWL